MNGEQRNLRQNEYMPDLMHQFVIDFITRHRDQPFCVYYSLSHVHAEILPTPDSAPGSKDLYADDLAYMDTLVGKLVAELDRLKLRENTLVIFVGDNGTAGGHADRATVGGRRLSGEKGSMLEGGALVPLIVNWPGGELFDMTHAPFEETLVSASTKDPAAIAARRRLQAALDKLNPAGGILDDGDGTGRHANRNRRPPGH